MGAIRGPIRGARRNWLTMAFLIRNNHWARIHLGCGLKGPKPVNDLLRELLSAIRSLGKTPGFTLTAVATLALGIAGPTAVFSLVNGILLRPLAYRDPERLVLISET